MSCVNKASLQFKDCCKRLDLSEQQLEQIVYDYTNQLGNENTFPTDTYIEQQLKGIPTSELSDFQRELYKLKYEEAQPLDTFELAQQRVLELQQYYPDDRIKTIQRNNGKYQVVINTDYSQLETEQEIQRIKEETVADGTFMKAPNGNPTNLTERQWLQVRTKSFINWFGDWINNPTNASKVVDENGEPLVVYRASSLGGNGDYTIFDETKGGNYRGFYFTNKKSAEINYSGRNLRAFFLNLTNPDTSNNFNLLQEDKRELPNNDGMIYAPDGIYADNFEIKVFNPNQIKSATDNNGLFDNNNPDIRYNLSSNKIYSLLLFVKDFMFSVQHQNSEHWFKNEILPVVKLYNGKLYIPKKGMKIDQEGNFQLVAIKALLEFIDNNGLKYAVKIIKNSNSVEVKIIESELEDAYEKAVDINNLFENSEDSKKVLNILNFLQERFGLTYNVVSEQEAKKVLGHKPSKELNAFYKNGSAYFIKGRKLNADIAAEEMLHPFVATIKLKYPLLYDELLKDALKLYPKLHLKIKEAYKKETEEIQNEELVTLALSRAFVHSREVEPKGYTVKSFLKKFTEWLKNLFTKAPSLNFENEKLTIDKLAAIVNSEISLSVDIEEEIERHNQQEKKQSLGTKEAPIQIYSDGSDIKGTGQIGYGAVFTYDGKEYFLTGTEEGEEVRKLKEKFPDAVFSNPTMEMLALATTLETIANAGIGEHIQINQDYKGAVNYGELWNHSEGSVLREPKPWKAKEPYIRYLVERALEAIKQIELNGGSVKIQWVKGHQSGSSELARMNDRADFYAKRRDNANNILEAYQENIRGNREAQTEEFYSKQSVDDYVRDLIAIDNIKREDIKVEHFPETEDTDEYWVVSYTTQQPETNTTSNLNSFINHSGGAIGSDSYWGEVGERYGVKSNHYYHGNKTPNGNVEITEEEFEEGKQHVLKANETLNRKPNSYMDLLARNWMQVKNADAVFAIGHLKKGIVDGGTGWAVQMAIDVNKPVYIFDQERNQWYKNINGVWSESEIPTLTPNFAGIGTRQLNDAGKKAIEEVYRKTFETQQSQQLLQDTTSTQELNVLAISNETSNILNQIPYTDASSVGVQVVADIKTSYSSWLQLNPNGIVAYRIGYNTFNSRQAVELGIIGNPFDWNNPKYGLKAGDLFLDWLLTGNNHGEEKANEDFRLAIISRIKNSPKDTKIAYYTANPLGNSHATTLGYLIQHPELLDANTINKQLFTQLPTLEEQQLLEEQTQEPSYEERQLAISEQVSNLISNDRGLKATELRQLSELMVYWMSEFISDCLDNPEKIFQILGITDYSDSDILKVTLMSRKQIVQMIGVENMFNLCKSYVLTPDVDGTGKGNANINSRALRRQAELLKSNFQGLMQFSTSVWSTLEDFSIGLTETGYNTLETSNPDAFLDEELIKERDKQADGESTLESWLVESNTIDALTTATQLVKRELLHCYLYENTGEVDDLGKPIKRIKTNKFGINERLNPREAINAIIKWVLGCWDLNSMVAALKEHQDKNPWVEQLINKLSDITGNESDFQSQFFSCMCRSFQLYGVVNENDKHELYQHSINKNPMLLMAFNGIKDLYKVGEHPLLKLDGIDRKAFKEFHEDVEQLINYSKLKYSEILNIDELNTLISHVYMLLGYYDATPDVVGAAMSDMTFRALVQNLLTLRTYLDNEKLNKLYNPFDFKANNSIISTLLNVLRPITYIMDDYAVTQFFESGNMRQSNVIPSFMTKLFSKMQLPLVEFEKFVEQEYGQFDWFYDKKLNKYKNEWLSRLVRMPEEERKKLFEHKVQLSFNKKQYMRGMTDSEYAVSVISEYFTAGKGTAWYKVPIMSNKPTSEFIKFIKYDDSDYKDRIVVGMLHIFVLELGRIQTIIKRQNAGINKSDPRFIKNFDKNGAKFCFLDFLNPFLNESKNTELGQLLNTKINGTRELSAEENARLNDLVKQEIRNSMEARVQQIMESWRQQGILTAVSLIQGFERKPEKAEGNWKSAANNAKIENFIWNDTFAAMEILLLTITDVAQYKDAEDLQKRLAQIHAPGVRGNIQARDYFGNQVSDGTHRAVYLTDFDDFISNVIDNVTRVFDKKIAEAPENEKAQWESLKESLVGENGAYRQINVADALAYACPTSYRKKAYMFGKWSREKESMYQQLMSGQYDFTTLKQAFGEPLKPFLYSYEEVDAGVENSPIETFKIGVQNKDSEYLLIMADALTRNEDTGIPNILRAIYDVMEESHKVKVGEDGRYIAATDGIDDIQFESTVKAGLYGRINLKQFSTDPQGETNAKNELRSKIFDGLGGYNSTYIHETRYEDYCIQQEVPEHFKDHSQAHGSQIRYIIPSDLPLTDANGETVVYSYFDPATGTERKLDAEQFKAEYENHCATNIQESLDLLKEEFGLVAPDGQINFDRKQMNQTLSEILKREILSSPRYGIDMLLACSLNADGEFNIPLGDPIQSRRIEQLINSIIKNRINKQKIAGGPVVQVTAFGTSKDLNIRFKSNKGGLLMTRKEFEKSKEEGTYEEYIEKYLDGIAYYEIYAPMYTNELFQQFADKDGNIDIKRIEKENPELLKIIGYRIPTEDKYSCFPAKIVGFLPREAGDAVMLPADITTITGSDFDVDKMYLMRKEFKELKKSKEELTKELESVLLKGLTGKAKDVTQKQIKDFMNLREGEKESAINNNTSNPIVKAYANMSKKRFVEYTEGRQYHNNMIVDMSYSVLTNKEIAYQVLNPGGFDLQKRMGYAIAAYKDPEVRSKYSFEQLMEMPIDGDGTTLKSLCYKNKNLAFFDTQVQFYKQNSAAGMILGMFAVLKIAHAVLESDGFGIDLGKVFIDKNTNEQIPFEFCGIPFLGIVEVDKRFDANNQLIGKTLGSLVASAADAVKDPVLNLNNINNQTANVLTTMLRLGVVYEDAALLLSQPAISKVLLEHSKRMVNKEFISLNTLIKSRMQELDDKYYMSESEKVQSEPLSREDLIKGFSESDVVEAEKLEWKVLNAYLKFNQMSLIIKGLTNATRYNSVSNAVGPLIIDNLIMEYKAGKFSDAITYNGTEAKNINSVFSIHPILDKFSLATVIARRLLGEMPAYSSDFRILVNNSGDYTLSKIMGDRKLFSKLSDFYQSYLLVLSGFINPKDREYYIDKFPVEFMKAKETYPDNPFVLAIRLSTGTFGGKTKGILTLDSVGMEQMLKDKLSSGWADLYKENPELAKKLFIYNFFKGGLGFSPKTFMNLVPISMKESIENNGIKYVDVYRNPPSLGNYSMVFDLFVGNNVGDFKLVPQRNPYSEHQNILGNRIIITTKFENYELDYFKVKGFNNIYRIFKLLLVDPITKRKLFVEIPVLGNQGEFFDVSATPINKSNVTNTNTLEEEGFEPLDEDIMTEEGYDPYYTKIAIDIIKNEKGLKDTKEAYETLKSSRRTQEGLSEQEAEQRKAKIREAVMNSLKRRNITFNEEELNKTTNEFC